MHRGLRLESPGRRYRRILPGFVTGIHKDSVRRWNLWFPSAGVLAEVLAGRVTGTQIIFPIIFNDLCDIIGPISPPSDGYRYILTT